jgi:hypothetical protein
MRAACSALELGLARDSGPTPNRSITAKTDKDAAMLDSLEKMLAKGARLTDRHSPLPAPAR